MVALQDKKWCDEISACLNHPLINAPDVLYSQKNGTGTVAKTNRTSKAMVEPIVNSNDDLDLFGDSGQRNDGKQEIESGEGDIDLYSGDPATPQASAVSSKQTSDVGEDDLDLYGGRHTTQHTSTGDGVKNVDIPGEMEASKGGNADIDLFGGEDVSASDGEGQIDLFSDSETP